MSATTDLGTEIEQLGQDGKLLASTVEHLKAWLAGGFLPDWATEAVSQLVRQEAWDELNDRFYKSMTFGTGGLRGRTMGRVSAPAETGTLSEQGTPEHPAVGSAYLNDFNVVRATIGLYRYCDRFLAGQGTYARPRLVIAHDVRHFSRHFCELASSAWTRLGGEALIFEGPRSTPQLSFTVRHLKATAGIVITASHNPPHDNGFKAYFNDGAQVVSPHAEGIIEEVNKIDFAELPAFLEKDISTVQSLGEDVDEAYLATLVTQVSDAEIIRKAQPKVVFTAIHGTGAIASVPALQRLGLEVEEPAEQAVQDPRFPTVKSPNPENAEALAQGIELAGKRGADVVIATDPDADRMGVAVRGEDGEMTLLTGNMIGSLLAESRIRGMKAAGVLPEAGTESATLIKTFVTTPLQEAIAKAHGLKCINTLTGFKWIGEKLKVYEDELKAALLEKQGIALDYDATPEARRFELLLEHSTAYVFGGEESYGYLASDSVRDKDANAAVILFVELAAKLKDEGKTFAAFLDELYLDYGYYLEDLVNIYMEGAAGAQQIANILKSYREDAPKEIGGVAVERFIDFGREEIFDADGKQIPAQDFYMLELANGYRYAVRGSGTEPKIKFYLFGREDVDGEASLADAKAKARETIDSLKSAIEADAIERAG